MSTFNAAKTNEKKKRSTYEKFKNSVDKYEVEDEPLLVSHKNIIFEKK